MAAAGCCVRARAFPQDADSPRTPPPRRVLILRSRPSPPALPSINRPTASPVHSNSSNPSIAPSAHRRTRPPYRLYPPPRHFLALPPSLHGKRTRRVPFSPVLLARNRLTTRVTTRDVAHSVRLKDHHRNIFGDTLETRRHGPKDRPETINPPPSTHPPPLPPQRLRSRVRPPDGLRFSTEN